MKFTKEQRASISLFTCWWAMHEAQAEVTDQPFDPESVALSFMGCGASTMVMVKHLRSVCDILNSLPTDSASPLPELPEPLEINWPTLNRQALGCGVDRAIECVPEAIYDAGQMNDHARLAWNMGLNEGLANPPTVTDTGLPELRDHLATAKVTGNSITLSPEAAGALHLAMTTPPEGK